MSASLPVSGHTNLSALQIIGSCVLSLLGPIKGVKCLFDEESNEGVLVTSTNELLQGLDIEHPVGQLVREFCLSQHKRHGSGCTTLVTLAGLWAANVQSLLNQDIPIQDIVRVGDEFLQECRDIAEQSAISIHSLSKTLAVTIERDEERDRMMLNTSTSLQSSNAKQIVHHGIIMSSEVREMQSVSLNQNSNNSCALPSHSPFQSATPAESNDHEQRKHSGESGIDSSNSSPGKKHTSTVLSTSSAKVTTSSAILKEDDVDDVSWFFENDSRYSDKAWDTDSTATGNLAGKLDEVSLQGCEQEKSSCVEKAVAELDDEDDVEWFFEDNHIISDSVSYSNDRQTTISSSMHEERGKDISLKVTDSKESEERLKTGESLSQSRHEQPHSKTVQDQEKTEQIVCRKDVHSVLEQSHKVPSNGESFTRTSSMKSMERLESLLKSAIEQKPSKLQKGSRRILSRHLLADEQESYASPLASETASRDRKPKMNSSKLGERCRKDEKTSVVPTLTQRETSSDHVPTQNVGKSFRMHVQNSDVTGVLADDLMKTEETTLKEQLSSEIETLGDSLNHGAVAEMKLAIGACHVQLMASQDPQRFDFNTDLVHVQTLTGPSSSSSCCIHGLVLPVLENQLITLQAVTGRRMVALLLNSDLQESYRHRGFKDSLKSSSVVSDVPWAGTSPNSVWTERILSSLKMLNVNMLMVRGSVDSSLVDACCFDDILILEHVPYRLLQLLGTVHKSNLLTYIPDALQDDLCDNIKVSYWSSGYDPHPTVRSRDLKIQHHVRLFCPGNVKTIILCAPSEPHLTGAEQRLHSCMARLQGALHDGKVLLGGGRIEQHLVEKLAQQTEHVTYFHQYRHELVYEALGEGFRAYTQHTYLNMDQCQSTKEDASPDAASCHGSPSSHVHDCFLAKIGAWQRAWHLVKQVLLCDALIVTGVDKGDKDLHRVL
ncbi:Bardet-Biedl syndrome 12 protein [Strongylocentrotus purpuratus]|uniref:Bardet-Biedl syndrome 12 n=1 Tax=Strongylocentrotus purpuratus TaxID=7668 RepID=A0A7M7LWM2_STRPU|nr:Bardet-Biedl syndrome 12 protein [Strongylocentrotus purpuratus]